MSEKWTANTDAYIYVGLQVKNNHRRLDVFMNVVNI